MAREGDEYTVDEAARVLGLSPARVRQMLRGGELEGERREERVEGVLGPWRIPAEAAHALRERLGAEDAETTAVLPPGETLPDAFPEGSGTLPSERTADTPSGVSERLSEGVRDLREKAEALLEELQRWRAAWRPRRYRRSPCGRTCGGRRSARRGCAELEEERRARGREVPRGP